MENDLNFHFADGTEVKVNKDEMLAAGGKMRLRKAHERLENCVCSWVAEPIEVRYGHESAFELMSERVMSGISYVRAMVHHINPQCTVHAWLLNPVGYVAKPLPRVSNIAVDSVPLANRPHTQAQATDGYEVLVEEGGVVSRREISVIGELGATEDKAALIARAREVWEEFKAEHADKMAWVIEYANAHTTLDRERIKYNARKNSEWYFMPVDDERGLGHCRSCHHDCRFEWHPLDDTGKILRAECQEPTCGHTAGCPGC